MLRTHHQQQPRPHWLVGSLGLFYLNGEENTSVACRRHQVFIDRTHIQKHLPSLSEDSWIGTLQYFMTGSSPYGSHQLSEFQYCPQVKQCNCIATILRTAGVWVFSLWVFFFFYIFFCSTMKFVTRNLIPQCMTKASRK